METMTTANEMKTTRKNKGLIITTITTTTTIEPTNRMKTITKVRILFLDWIAGLLRMKSHRQRETVNSRQDKKNLNRQR